MELNRGGVGVPLEKLAHVVDEAQKFFRMLAADVHIDPEAGEWLGLDFGAKSLNFTAEFVGPVTATQMAQFHAAFDGVTLLRRATIGQFARIAGAIGEDELIGFGLYHSDEETEPAEWRSLSKRDALRISEEIQLLLDRAGDAGESRLPTALDPGGAAALFKERREPGGLAERVARLESAVSRHDEAIEALHGNTASTEQNLQKLLVAVDSFCDRATRQMERLPAPAAPEPQRFRWAIPLGVAAVCVAGVSFFWSPFETRPLAIRAQSADPASATPSVPEPAEALIETPAEAGGSLKAGPTTPAPGISAASVRVDLRALEPTWVAVYVDGEQTFAKLLDTDQTTTIDSTRQIRVRLGNAGGVEISANGRNIGPIGRKGEVRMIEFTAAGFRTIPLNSPMKSGA
jgi:hypothetical protein